MEIIEFNVKQTPKAVKDTLLGWHEKWNCIGEETTFIQWGYIGAPPCENSEYIPQRKDVIGFMTRFCKWEITNKSLSLINWLGNPMTEKDFMDLRVYLVAPYQKVYDRYAEDIMNGAYRRWTDIDKRDPFPRWTTAIRMLENIGFFYALENEGVTPFTRVAEDYFCPIDFLNTYMNKKKKGF